MKQVNVSVVLFNNEKQQVMVALNSFLNTNLDIKIHLIDNSDADHLKVLTQLDDRVTYLFNNGNLGFGKAHNLAIKHTIAENIKYHIVSNPDIYFNQDVSESIYDFMEENPDVGLVMPKVLNPDGSTQYLCKLLPSPFDVFGRRFLNWGPLKKFIDKNNWRYELRFCDYNEIMEIPYLSGCFMFLRVDALKRVGVFDERFFMYPEDIDLTRRIHRHYKTIYYPYVSVVHEHAKESYKNVRLLFIHVINLIRYFNKWGWFFDRERKAINQKTHEKLKNRRF